MGRESRMIPPATRISVGILDNKWLGNCSNDGISDRFNKVMLINGAAWDAMSDPEKLKLREEESFPLVRTVERKIGGEVYIHAEPVDPPPPGFRGWMAGGAFLKCSDSRYRDVAGINYPISLHDRMERA
jgi:hypothetical protein